MFVIGGEKSSKSLRALAANCCRARITPKRRSPIRSLADSGRAPLPCATVSPCFELRGCDLFGAGDPKRELWKTETHGSEWTLGNWSGRWESNPRHTAWEAVVLPLNYARKTKDLFDFRRRRRTTHFLYPGKRIGNWPKRCGFWHAQRLILNRPRKVDPRTYPSLEAVIDFKMSGQDRFRSTALGDERDQHRGR
jgi:hypothetical protein